MNKKVAIMQPYFLPYIGYFQLINAVDEFVIYDDVNYINKGWINRNNLLVNNKASLFSVPLKEASQNKLICDIEIIQDGKWQKKLLKTIEQSYKKAPNFNEVFHLMEEIINFEELNISTYIHHSLLKICEYLNIKTKIIESSHVFLNNQLKAQERILDICKKTEALEYINPIGGRELYDKTAFAQQNIQLQFINSHKIQYRQFSDDFVSYLSILDLLMFKNKAEIQILLNEFDLI